MTEPAPPSPSDHVGRILGSRWRLDRELAKGGQAIVYVATEVEVGDDGGVHDHGTPETAVVKVTDGSGAIEIDFLTALHHQHLVPRFAAGRLIETDRLASTVPNRGPGDLRWIAMPRALGTLAESIGERATPTGVAADRPLDPRDAVELWTQLRSVLAYLASQQVVHGDIKPSNVLAFATRTRPEWRLADLGIMVDLRTGETHARARGVTPAYSSPWVLSSGIVRPRDDLYSAALVVHLAATGALPTFRDRQPTLHPKLPVELHQELLAALHDGAPVDDRVTRAPFDPVASTGSPPTQPPTTGGGSPDGGAQIPRRSRTVPVWAKIAAALAAVALIAALAILLRPSDDATGSGDDDRAASAGDPDTDGSSDNEATDVATGDASDDDATTTSATTNGDLDSGRTLLFVRRSGGAHTIVRGDGADALPLAGVDPIAASVAGDGTLAVIVETDEGTGVAIGRIDEATVRLLDLPGDVTDVDISPDGSQVAYTTDASGDTDVAIVDLGSMEVRTLLGGSGDEDDPAWSPDGTQLAAVRSRSTGAEVVVVEVSSGSVSPVSDGTGDVRSPTFSPDGRSIAYLAEDGEGIDVVVQAIDEAAPQVLALTPDDELEVTWCETELVASYSRRGLAAFTPDGGRRDLTDAPGDARPNC